MATEKDGTAKRVFRVVLKKEDRFRIHEHESTNFFDACEFARSVAVLLSARVMSVEQMPVSMKAVKGGAA